MSEWWSSVERSLEEISATAPDPWGVVFALPGPQLTGAQRDFLAQLADQPEVARLSREGMAANRESSRSPAARRSVR